MYSISGYTAMVTDAVRVDAYARALRSVVTRESFVLEIGTGVGVFAVMARQMGARRVVAIEPDDAIAVGRALARDNGVDDIEFIQGLSGDVTLSERADVIVSDLRGMLPLYNGHLASIIDARDRLLAPGGTLIPSSDTLYAAAVSLPEASARRLPPRTPVNGVKLEVLRGFVSNTWDRARFAPEHLLTSPIPWAALDYRAVSASNVSGEVLLRATQAGAAHGLAVWFDATLVDGVTFSNAPDQPELVYGTAFFPWPDPVDVQAGDEIAVRIDAHHVGDDYVWRWACTVTDRETARTKASFRQSTMQAAPFVPAKLARGAAAHVPVLSEDGQVEAFILHAMDGCAANDAIVRALMERFPGRFATANDALGRIGSVARRFAGA